MKHFHHGSCDKRDPACAQYMSGGVWSIDNKPRVKDGIRCFAYLANECTDRCPYWEADRGTLSCDGGKKTREQQRKSRLRKNRAHEHHVTDAPFCKKVASLTLYQYCFTCKKEFKRMYPNPKR